MGYWLCATNDIEDIKVNVWYWGATVPLIHQSEIFEFGTEVFRGSVMVVAKRDGCVLLADWLEKNVLDSLPVGSRIMMSGEVTTEPNDGTFHREDTAKNYSVDREWLLKFVTFLKECGGFYTLG